LGLWVGGRGPIAGRLLGLAAAAEDGAVAPGVTSGGDASLPATEADAELG
jgi:hypothetical protein